MEINHGSLDMKYPMGEEVPSYLSENLAHAHEMERAGEKAWKKNIPQTGENIVQKG